MKNFTAIMTTGLVALLASCSSEPTPPPTPNHLIILTGAGGGKVDASFMTVETLEECERRAGIAKKVFPSADIKYIFHFCTSATAKFQTFGHNPEPEGEGLIFDLQFSKDGKVLKKVIVHPTMEACEKSRNKLCIISYQSKL